MQTKTQRKFRIDADAAMEGAFAEKAQLVRLGDSPLQLQQLYREAIATCLEDQNQSAEACEVSEKSAFPTHAEIAAHFADTKLSFRSFCAQGSYIRQLRPHE